jgi:hypothetical protein
MSSSRKLIVAAKRMGTALFWTSPQGVVVIPCRRFGTTKRSHLQESLGKGPIGCPETSVRNYRYSLRINPEERGFRLLAPSCLSVRPSIRNNSLPLDKFS